MSTEARAELFPAADWDGGTLPYKVGHRKLGMWLFIISDALTFSALLIGYSYVRASSEQWPEPFHFYPSIVFSSVMTFFSSRIRFSDMTVMCPALTGRMPLNSKNSPRPP